MESPHDHRTARAASDVGADMDAANRRPGRTAFSAATGAPIRQVSPLAGALGNAGFTLTEPR